MMIVLSQYRSHDGVADTLIVLACLPHGAFVSHAAFSHDSAGVGIVDVVGRLDTIHADFFEEEFFETKKVVYTSK